MQLPIGQRRVWETLVRHHQQSGTMPTARDLTGLLKMTRQSLGQHLDALASKGLIDLERRGSGKPVLVSFTAKGKVLARMGIPLLGSIAAGPLGEAQSEYRGLLALPTKPGYFALSVEGDSMADYFVEGDVVIVFGTHEVSRGQIAAVHHQGKTTLKYVYPRGRTIELKPHNPRHPELKLPASEVQIQGVYHSMIRGKLIGELLEVDM